MKTLEDFKKRTEPKRRLSKLEKFRDEIFDLYNSGYKVEQIQDYLLENNVKVSRSRLYSFISSFKCE